MMLKIETTDALKDFCAQLKKQPFITVDTEFVRTKTYRAVLCLIQIAAPNGLAACIDPISKDLDLKPLLLIMKNKKIVKVFHSARQDLEIFYDLMNALPQPLFDTQVAAMVCGLGESVSYHNIVHHYLGLDLDKSQRETDWSARPLAEKQLVYALADVTHLIHVYEKICQEVKEKNRLSWIDDEMNALLNVDLYKPQPDEMWKKLKPASTKPEYLAVLKALCSWREKMAIKLNKPRRHIMRDEIVLELAALSPTKEQDFDHFRSKGEFSHRHEYAPEIMKIIQKALALSADKMPQPEKEKPLTATQHAIKEMLRLLLTITSDQLGVAPKIIAGAEDLDKMAREEYDNNRVMTGWRFEVFGQKALDFQRGKLALFFDGKKKKLIFEKH